MELKRSGKRFFSCLGLQVKGGQGEVLDNGVPRLFTHLPKSQPLLDRAKDVFHLVINI